MQRRQVLLGTTTVLSGLAGCTGEDAAPQPTNGNRGPTETPEPTLAPSNVSDEAAKERALSAEETHLTDYLSDASCLTDWGTTPTTVSKQATVTNRTAEGVYVEVTHPYWFSTDSSEVDAGSDAVYAVTADTVRRESGDEIADAVPC